MSLRFSFAHAVERLGDGIVLLPGRAPATLDAAVHAVLAAAPPRHMSTPWGKSMSAAMTNCGVIGWVSDAAGYRYEPRDPLTGLPWPAMPDALARLANEAAAEAGFAGFRPDCCLVNRYDDGARMGLHQDRDECDLTQPIVSVSLGRSAVFRFGACSRNARTRSRRLHHGDVLVFGGPARLMHHGIDRLLPEPHPTWGTTRINLTFRRTGLPTPPAAPS